MFIHLFTYRLKTLLRTKSIIFWTFAFPLILATFFNLAFSNLASEETFNIIKIGIIQDDEYKQETNFKQLIESLSNKGDNQVFEVSNYSKEKEAVNSLEDNDIEGIYQVKDNQIKIIVKQNNLNSTIMKMIVDEYYQKLSLVSNINIFHPESLTADILAKLNTNYDFFNDKSNDKVDSTVIYFYTLIGMTCIYAGFFGIDAIDVAEANQSKKGARLSVSPTNKLKALLSFLLAGFTIQFIENLLLLAYLVFGLGIDFGNQVGYILLVMGVGSVAGITLGTVIGSLLKCSNNTKVGIHIAVSMIFSFLSGMMMIDMKYIIAKHAPIIGNINPVNMITDALYSLYYYDSMNRYYSNIIGLIIFSVVMIVISYLAVRRKKYDSI